MLVKMHISGSWFVAQCIVVGGYQHFRWPDQAVCPVASMTVISLSLSATHDKVLPSLLYNLLFSQISHFYLRDNIFGKAC
jgi:hypothetical protein